MGGKGLPGALRQETHLPASIVMELADLNQPVIVPHPKDFPWSLGVGFSAYALHS